MHCWYCICRLFYACMKNVASQALSVSAFFARKSIDIWDHWTIITFHSPNSKFPLSFLFRPLPVLHFGSHTLPLGVSLMFLASLFVKDNKSDSKHYMCIETYLIEPIFLQPVSSTAPRHRPHKDPGTRPFWNQPKSKACLGLEFHWSSD